MIALLAGCEEGNRTKLFQSKSADSNGTAAATTSTKLIERDVEAPEVFQATEAGLWDGRPSLGGVWVAHADVTDPERVIIRNAANGKFVIGALFRRERETPGPKFQISSDAAAALDMLAGAPQQLNVTALRREEVPEATPAPDTAAALPPPDAIESSSLDPIAGASAAISTAEAAAKPVAAAPAPKPKPKTSKLSKPYIQLGIFSVETNANNTATAMRTAGMVSTVKKQSSSGKTFWRVLVGPAASSSEHKLLMKKVKAAGFTDAYAVSN